MYVLLPRYEAPFTMAKWQKENTDTDEFNPVE